MTKHLSRILSILLIIFIFSTSILPQKPAAAQAPDPQDKITFVPIAINDAPSWPMAAGNPQRTSWTEEEVRGRLYPQWYRSFEPYIAPKVQVIAENGMLYIATARGLYALDARNGADRWVFATELPLGNSPTVDGSTVYVGGMDKNLYALDAMTGQLQWVFTAGAGWDTNPLVIDGVLYAGNRDGGFYAIYASGPNTGQLAWKYQTGGPVHFSAAYKSGVVFFASDDSYAYALDAASGGLVWKSDKLPGAGFHSWWPVVYQDKVVFAGSPNYRTSTPPGSVEWLSELDREYMFGPDPLEPASTTLIGPRLSNGWIDAARVTEYYQTRPHRRTNFVLNRSNGQEEVYAPFLWFGTHSGNRYPPVVAADGIIYQSAPFASQQWGFRGEITGWKIGTSQISTPSANNFANDEPVAYAAGGDVIYYNLCCDRSAGAFDTSIPNNGTRDQRREWIYFEYDLATKLPGYGARYHSEDIDATFGGGNGVYGLHGDQNPPIPYKGMVYTHRSNTLIAFGPTQRAPARLPLAATRDVAEANQPVDRAALQAKLEDQVQKMISKGHLRPAYGVVGSFDQQGRKDCGDNLLDYYANPADTLYTLLIALPHLKNNPTLYQSARTYIQTEFNTYKPYEFLHVGWNTGAAREPYIMTPDIDKGRAAFPERNWTEFEAWRTPDRYPPQFFYALWLYAKEFGGAQGIFEASRNRLMPSPSNTVLTKFPFALNAYIAGHIGYLNLEKLAYPTRTGNRTELNRLLDLRRTTFTKDSPYGEAGIGGEKYCKTMNVARNFMNLVPELGDDLRATILGRVQQAVAEYNDVAPYWFATRFEATYAEGASQPMYDYEALFKARALILNEPASRLVKYLDAPAYPVGDLFYIQNLVMVLEAQ
jgi:outer membrane protein assembly factor BamB